MSMSSKIIDITGQRFERLTVIRYAGLNKHQKAMWECKCDCGKTITVLGKCLRNGNTKSCGCYTSDRIREYSKVRWKTHGESGTRLHHEWTAMNQRCRNPNHESYANYGGRGITVCDEWAHSFTAFRDWALQNGYQDDLTIDRIDNDSGYCPSNCRWVDYKTQSRNNSRNVVITYRGETHCLTDWVDILGLNYKIMRARIVDKGWEPSIAFETPYGSNQNRKDEVLSYHGEERPLREWAEVLSIPYERLRNRLYVDKWDLEKAFSTPFREHKPYPKRTAK